MKDYDLTVSNTLQGLTEHTLRTMVKNIDTTHQHRFTVQPDGQLSVYTGPLKRDNAVVRFFKGLFSQEYRTNDKMVKLALNTEFQTRLTRRVLSLFPTEGKSAPAGAKEFLANKIKSSLLETTAKSQGGAKIMSLDGLRQAFNTAQILQEAVTRGISQALTDETLFKKSFGDMLYDSRSVSEAKAEKLMNEIKNAAVQAFTSADETNHLLNLLAKLELPGKGALSEGTVKQFEELAKIETSRKLEHLWEHSKSGNSRVPLDATRADQMLKMLKASDQDGLVEAPDDESEDSLESSLVLADTSEEDSESSLVSDKSDRSKLESGEDLETSVSFSGENDEDDELGIDGDSTSNEVAPKRDGIEEPAYNKKIGWENRTPANTTGVCEAAVTIWLSNIMEGGPVYDSVPQPADCDSLQNRLMAPGPNSTNWVSALAGKVDEIAGMKTGTTVFFSGHYNDYNPAILKGANSHQDGLNWLLNEENLPEKGFIFLSASSGGGKVGHAIGIFRQENVFYIFDPNSGVYEANGPGTVALIRERTVNWSLVTATNGSLHSD